MSATNPVPKIYRAVIDDVIKNVKEAFLNEGVDDQVLQELKQLWESKLLQSRAIDFMPTDVNVRVSLTYPHHQMQGGSHEQQQAGSSQQRQQPSAQQRQQPSAQPTHAVHATTGHLPHNQPGQLVYVSSHPTLGNVGPMSGAAAQAAIALQNTPQATTTLISQQLPGLSQVQQAHVIHLHQGNPAGAQAGMFPAYHGNRPPMGAPRVIFTNPQQQQQHVQSNQKQQVIQVDGAADYGEPCGNVAQDQNATSLISSNLMNMKSDEIILQLDGANDSSSDEFEDDDEDIDSIPVAHVGAGGGGGGPDAANLSDEEEEPLNSEDDVSDEDPTDLFDTDNVVVCQYDKIARVRNRWKFHLKDGIMNLKSKDFVFHKANGDSEW